MSKIPRLEDQVTSHQLIERHPGIRSASPESSLPCTDRGTGFAPRVTKGIAYPTLGGDNTMLKAQIQSDMKTAMKSGEKARLGAIRLILAAIKQREVDERIELDDSQVLVVLDKMLKQRRDSIQQYSAAGREDLADVERFEVEVIQTYLPTPLSESELAALLDAAITESGAAAMSDMGKVMAILRPKVQGRADMAAVSGLVKGRLGA
jgi:uncharacterized protein